MFGLVINSNDCQSKPRNKI